jgi:hypothetical protein
VRRLKELLAVVVAIVAAAMVTSAIYGPLDGERHALVVVVAALGAGCVAYIIASRALDRGGRKGG